ncbi:Uma2 family endonuclease [Planctomicrobium sp. SH661]|uniref:Uma2 family endonuclease n=1 Tax=Planctomicrobium sp. SH661 TaxID=3448124 RepID=UPI003F5B77CB
MPTQTFPITAEQFMEMHFDVPVELVRGEVVYPYGDDGMTRPGWQHSVVCQNVGALLWNWCRSGQYGRVMSNDTGILTERNPDTLRGPDLFFVSTAKLSSGPIPSGVPGIIPDVCIEVLSPNDRWQQVRHKITEYLDCGVPEVWVLEVERKTLHVFLDNDSPRALNLGSTVTSDVLLGFSCLVDDLFEST